MGQPSDARTQYLDELRAKGTVLRDLYAVDTPFKRIRGIYRTSRFNISYKDAGELWDVLTPVRALVDVRVESMKLERFDEVVVECAWQLQRRLTSLQRSGGFGVGQKVVNLYLKDQWALGRVDQLESVLHLPLDRTVLEALGRAGFRPPTWRAWTKVCPKQRSSVEVADYLGIQRFARNQASAMMTTS